jgi:DNA-binding response OmpR family regulator
MTVAAGLRRLGIAVDLAFDGTDALHHIAVTEYDVVVLDRDLPRTHGDDVCRRMVQDGRDCLVLMLTAAGEVEDRVNGLGIGADDYLAKPFDFSELVARIHALARRSHPRVGPTLIHGDLVVDCAQHIASRAGRPLSLSPKEFAVLERLLAARGAVVSAEELLAQVWDGDANPFSQAVKTTISRLRSKLGPPPVIVTVAKSGYRI